GVGYSGVTPVLTTSLFPAHVRGRAIGFVYHTGALLAAFTPASIPWLVGVTGMSLATTVMVVVGSGLILMAAAVLVLRNMISAPIEQAAASASSQVPAERAAMAVSTRALEPISVPVADRELAPPAERSAIAH